MEECHSSAIAGDEVIGRKWGMNPFCHKHQQHTVPGCAMRDPHAPQQQSSHGSDPDVSSIFTSSSCVGMRPVSIMCSLTSFETYTACQSMQHAISSID